MGQRKRLPNDENTEAEVMAILKAWLPQINPDYLKSQGWQEINSRLHPQAMSARIFANTHFSETDEGEQRSAFFVGAVFGLLGSLHVEDVQELQSHLMPNGDNFRQQRSAPPNSEVQSSENQEPKMPAIDVDPNAGGGAGPLAA